MEEDKPTIKSRLLDLAEIIDAFRVIPRAFLAVYGVLVYNLYTWFIGIATSVKTSCDAALIETLLKNGVDLAQAQEVACTVVDIVGGPTTAQAAFVTTIVGLSAAVFGLYANSGRGWGSKKKDVQ